MLAQYPSSSGPIRAYRCRQTNERERCPGDRLRQRVPGGHCGRETRTPRRKPRRCSQRLCGFLAKYTTSANKSVANDPTVTADGTTPLRSRSAPRASRPWLVNSHPSRTATPRPTESRHAKSAQYRGVCATIALPAQRSRLRATQGMALPGRRVRVRRRIQNQPCAWFRLGSSASFSQPPWWPAASARVTRDRPRGRGDNTRRAVAPAGERGGRPCGRIDYRCSPRASGGSRTRSTTQPCRRLLATRASPAAGADFPPDFRQGGFTVNDAQRIDAVLVERLANAADALATEARANGTLARIAPCGNRSRARRCARAFIAAFGPKVYRRPLVHEEVTALLALYAAGAAGATYEDGNRSTSFAGCCNPRGCCTSPSSATPRRATAPSRSRRTRSRRRSPIC